MPGLCPFTVVDDGRSSLDDGRSSRKDKPAAEDTREALHAPAVVTDPPAEDELTVSAGRAGQWLLPEGRFRLGVTDRRALTPPNGGATAARSPFVLQARTPFGVDGSPGGSARV